MNAPPSHPLPMDEFPDMIPPETISHGVHAKNLCACETPHAAEGQ